LVAQVSRCDQPLVVSAGRVSVVIGLEPTREVEIALPGAYKIGPGIRAAVKSLPGILDVHDI